MGPSEVQKKSSLGAEFQALLNEHLNPLFGHAVNLTRSKTDAEDLLQEASLRAFKAFDKFERGTNFKAWIFTILRNLFFNEFRKRKRTPTHVSLDETSEFSFYGAAHRQAKQEPARFKDPASIDLSQLEGALGDEVSEALKTLPTEYQEALYLCEVEDFSYEEIAKITGVPIGTVRSRLSRARSALQKQLWDYAQKNGLLRKPAP